MIFSVIYFILIIIVIFYISTINIENFGQKMTRECSSIDNQCYQIQQKYDKSTYGGAADMLAAINKKDTKITMSDEKFNLRKEMTLNLMKRYNPGVIREHDPKGIKNTSYVWKKGEEIGYCLRERETGKFNLHKMDILFFVNLHEISHLTATKYDPGHKQGFWKNFKIVLEEAIDAGIYNPVNYKQSPNKYCGLDVKYNPYYDGNL